jgi:hypothetical protein
MLKKRIKIFPNVRIGINIGLEMVIVIVFFIVAIIPCSKYTIVEKKFTVSVKKIALNMINK